MKQSNLWILNAMKRTHTKSNFRMFSHFILLSLWKRGEKICKINYRQCLWSANKIHSFPARQNVMDIQCATIKFGMWKPSDILQWHYDECCSFFFVGYSLHRLFRAQIQFVGWTFNVGWNKSQNAAQWKTQHVEWALSDVFMYKTNAYKSNSIYKLYR